MLVEAPTCCTAGKAFDMPMHLVMAFSMPLRWLFLPLQAAMYQNIGNISVVDVVFDSNVATGSGGGLYQNSFAGELHFCQVAAH